MPPKAAKPASTARATNIEVPRPEPNQPVDERVTKVRAQRVVSRPAPTPKEPPDLVRVRALEKGQAGLDIDIIIRNPGEVFDMSTSVMRKYPLAKGEHPVEGATIIETDKGMFELPGWVELAPEEDVSEPFGHAKSIRGQTTPEGRTMEVL